MIRLSALIALAATALQAFGADIVSRSAWQARPPRSDISTYEQYGLRRPLYSILVLHVTSMGHGEGAKEVRRIQDFHMDDRGFSDIGYNFLIDAAGMVFEGRTLDHVPAHAGRSVEADAVHDIRRDPDFGAIGIAFSADADEALTNEQVTTAIEFIEQLRSGHPVKVIITHAEVKELLLDRGLTPQHDFDPADCPGEGSVEQMIRIRRAVDPDFDEAGYRALFE